MNCLKLPLLCLLVFCCLSGISQTVWLRSAGGGSSEEILDIDESGNSSIVATGYFNSTSDFWGESHVSSGVSDIFVSKLSTGGFAQWTQSFGGNGPDRGIAVTATGNGEVLCTGFFSGTVDFGIDQLTADGDSLDIFVLKLDAAGVPLWVRQAGGIGNDIPTGIAVDYEGNAFVSGFYRGEALFGDDQLISEFYGGTDSYSVDGFVAKIDPDGEWQWVQNVSSDEDNRCLDVVCDDDGNVYMTGQFSSNLTIDQYHPNDTFNVGMVVKLDADGNEDWISMMAANLTIPYEIEMTSDGFLAVGGDYLGQLVIIDSGTTTIPFEEGNHVFVSKWDLNGDHLWINNLSSLNEVTGQGMATGPNGEIYLVGNFTCSFTELSDQLGESAFYSMGYRDVFAMAVSPEGDHLWQRHFASPGETLCMAASMHFANELIIGGGFQKYFHVPTGADYIDYVENTFGEVQSGLTDNDTPEYCDNTFYDEFLSVEQTGSADGTREIFISSCFNSSAPLLDYFTREGDGCELVINEHCLGSWLEPECPDTIAICDDQLAIIEYFHEMGPEGIFGPSFEFNWSSNFFFINDDIGFASSEGWYWLELNRFDGCYSMTDSIYLLVNPTPPDPLISDSLYINIEQEFTEEINVCEQPVYLWSDTCLNCEIEWLDGIPYEYGTVATQTGEYWVTAINEFGCTESNYVYVDFDLNLELLGNPSELNIYSNGTLVSSDSLFLCLPDDIDIIIEPYPSLYLQNEDYLEYAEYQVKKDGEVIMDFDGFWTFEFDILEPGFYEFYADPVDVWENLCGSDSAFFLQLYNSIYIGQLALPELDLEVEIDDPLLCPGSSTLIHFSGADTYNPTIFGEHTVLNDSTIIALDALSGWVIGESVSSDGCSEQSQYNFSVSIEPAPTVYMNPENGIVCPGDSVQLICPPGLAYSWIGPFNNEISTDQTVWVTTPGYYYCIRESNTECVQESNLIEVSEYTTPILVSDAGEDICTEASVVVDIQTNFPEEVSWGAPFFDDALSHEIFDAGTYTVEVTGCGIINELEINVALAEAEADIITESAILCPLDTTYLEANIVGEQLLWSPFNTSAPIIEVTEGGWFYLDVIDQFGCTAHDSIQIVEDSLPAPNMQNVVVCYGEDYDLIANSAYDVFWSENDNGWPIISSLETLNLTNVTEEQSYFVFSSDGSCTSEPLFIEVGVSEANILPDFDLPDSLCVGGSINIDIDEIDYITYTWDTPTGAVNQADLFIDEAGSEDAGTYTLYLSDPYCSATSAPETIQIFESSIQYIDDAPVALCEGEEYILSTPIEATEYVWQTPEGTVYGNPLVINGVETTDSGVYSLAVSGAACSFSFYNTELYVGEYPEFSLNDSSLTCYAALLYASVPEGFESYEWSTGETETEIIVQETGPLSITITNAPYCARTEEIYIVETDCGDDYFNIITPNADGTNDYIDFGLHPLDFHTIKIYNRWGHVVRHLTGNNLRWDGRDDDGDFVSEGTYYWIGQAVVGKSHGDVMVRY
ncbi:gliding motility-associated C-terminal domain-containing protein [Sanyastnella coralliicola]|uniref:T9SS type B sorting domain-containing protein n=1 Tax=Sanyastnella coralliicola TaxID=3069118 RepID=UPI0027B8D366|nr:gliding motility-associated C-terminal domain-containing protein [Longitalea sp. SCSIO 12813]